jgi:predicted transcriptional regulator of viral defense system
MDRQTALKLLADVAREQAGYVTAAQAKRLDVKGDDVVRLARQGDLRRVTPGVYAFPGTFPGPREDTLAGWLRLVGNRLPWDATVPPAVVSHASAAAIHGFGTFVPASPTFTVRGRRFQPPDASIRLFTARLDPIDWQWSVLPEGIRLPVTTPARTIVDLAFVGEERDHVLDALVEARERGLVDDMAVAEAAARRRRRRGRGTVTWLAKALEPK